MNKIVFALAFSLFLGGCASFKVPQEDLQTTNIKTNSEIDNVIINKKYDDIKRVNFVVLKTKNNTDYLAHRKFMKEMLSKVGFKKIITEEEFVALIIENELSEQISDTDNLLALHKVYKEVGEFLVIYSSMNHTGNAMWDNQIIIIDPEKPQILLKTHDVKTLWADLDSELSYPTINFINDWYKMSL